MTDKEKHMIEATVFGVAQNVEALKSLRETYRQTYTEFDRYVALQKSGKEKTYTDPPYEMATFDLMHLIYTSVSLGNDTIDECFSRFLNACVTMDLRPRDHVDEVSQEINVAMSPFHSTIRLLIQSVPSGDHTSKSKQEVVRWFVDHIDADLKQHIDEAAADARKGHHKGVTVWTATPSPAAKWMSNHLLQFLVATSAAVAAGVILWRMGFVE